MDKPYLSNQSGFVEWFGKTIDLRPEKGKLETLFWLYAGKLADTFPGMAGRMYPVNDLIAYLWDQYFVDRVPGRQKYEARLRTLLKRLRERIAAAGIDNVQIHCRTQYGHQMRVVDPNAKPPKTRIVVSADNLHQVKCGTERLCTYCDQDHWTATDWTVIKRGNSVLGYACKAAFDRITNQKLKSSRIVTSQRASSYRDN